MQLARSSGILLHVSSLPSPFGIGDLGPGAHAFLEYLRAAGQRVWQVLPLVPVDFGGSPYSSSSTFAGNPLFVSPERLAEEGLIDEQVVQSAREAAQTGRIDQVDYRAAHAVKDQVLGEALRGFRSHAGPAMTDAYQAFRHAHEHWLGDYALFTAIKESNGGKAWTSWPAGLARRDPSALDEARHELADRIEHHTFAQFLFERQWQHLKQRANALGIRIFGDLPIYVAHDSADVWAHPELFHLDGDGNPTVVSGVPPDYFSETGQRWGNPIYRWDLMATSDYPWWLDRFERCFQLVDLLRIDHFRGMEAYWEIPASESTAVNGRWVAGPGAALFKALERRMGRLPIVAEDLGLITPEVTALMEDLGLPGMAVLHFAFGGDATSSYLPHNFKRDLVAYTGTHDNDTTIGWWRARADAEPDSQGYRERAYAMRYLGDFKETEVNWAFIHLLMVSVADLVIFPFQDVLGIGSEGRMNVPGKNEGNWLWRAQASDLREDAAARLREMVTVYGRG